MTVHLDPLISVVPVDVTAATAKVWVGSLSSWNAPPEQTRIRYRPQGAGSWTMKTVTDAVAEWEWVLPSLKGGWYRTMPLSNLTPGTEYEVQFGRISDGEFSAGGQCFLETLPTSVPAAGSTPFTVMVGSCFYADKDRKQTSAAYQCIYEKPELKPQLKFLVGDQVYADIGIPLFPLDSARTRQRFLEAYKTSWTELSGLLRRGVNVFLPDDHEYFNDYPFEPPIASNVIALRDDSYRRNWIKSATACVNAIQYVSPVRRFSVGTDLSFCAADLRSMRSTTTLLPAAEFAKIEAWVNTLTTPGVLVVSQLILRGKGTTHDHSLADFTTQYQQLIRLLSNSKHDIVVLTGDVHFGRIASVPLNDSGARLIEVVTSPLSNLTGIYSVSTSVPDTKPSSFPPIPVPGVSKQTIAYHRAAGTLGKDLFDYVKSRTHEHFVTIGFNKKGAKIAMAVDGWRVRNDGKAPVRAYQRWTTDLI
jgi:hypothetical protein